MKLINKDLFDIISCEKKSPDFINGVGYMLDLIDAAPVVFDLEEITKEILDYGMSDGVLIKDPSKIGMKDEYSNYLPVNKVIKILEDYLKK